MCSTCRQSGLALVPELEAELSNHSKYSGMSYESGRLQPPAGKVKKVLNTEPVYLINVKGRSRLVNDAKSLPTVMQCTAKIVFDRFALAEYALRFHHYALLIDVHNHIQAFAGDPDIVIIIEGHADKSGNEVRNAGLSMNRAFEVFRFLRELSGGQLPIGFIINGLGSSRPVPGADASKNRRVEIRLCRIIPPPVVV